MSVDSHVQLPNFVLEHFRSKNGKVAYLDLQLMRIRYCGSGKLGTIYGYYSDAMEQFLCEERETPFSRLASEVIRFVEEKKTS